MLTKLQSVCIQGLNCQSVEVEFDLGGGKVDFFIIGLGDAAIQEARFRVRSSIKHSGLKFPKKRIVCNLAPADLRKHGPCYDLPLAMGILRAGNLIPNHPDLEKSLFVGELALDGYTRPVSGVIGIAMYALERSIKKIFVPAGNASEASLIRDIDVYPVNNLIELVEHFQGLTPIIPTKTNFSNRYQPSSDLDFKYVRGQELAIRGLEISAAAGHNVLLNGAPGTGKTLMARTFPTILPPLTEDEMLEVTRIYSIANLLSPKKPLMRDRPFRVVHHTASHISIVGGGKLPGPGEITLAHRGVLFFDEIAEFPSRVLETLRQPLEDKQITINRVNSSVTFPAQFIFLAAMNPCPCGYYNVPNSKQDCDCSMGNIQRYQKRLSGPLLDRIDLHLNLGPVASHDLIKEVNSESSESIKTRVLGARNRQLVRYKQLSTKTNSELSLKGVKKFCKLDLKNQSFLVMASEKLNLSARGYFKVLKVARTIADLAGAEDIGREHLAEALQYRRSIL